MRVRSRVLFALVLTVALVGAACSSPEGTTADDPSLQGESETSETAAGGALESVISADGLLTVTPPAGTGPIVIDVITSEDGVHSYELGPDGAQFDEPVRIEFKITTDDLAGGVFGVVESGEDTLEALDLVLVDIEGGQAVRTTLEHFSRITIFAWGDAPDTVANISLDAPREVPVGDNVPLSLYGRVETKTVQAYQLGMRFFALTFDSGQPEDWQINPPLEGTPPDSVTCVAPGSAVVKVDGVFKYDLWVRGEIFVETDNMPIDSGTAVFSGEDQVTCVERTPIREADRKCIDRSTGLEAEGCLFPESVSVSGDDPAEFRIDFSAGNDPVDPIVTFSVFMNEDESNPVLIEHHSDGTTNGYYGPGLLSFPTGGEVTGGDRVETDSGSHYVFTPNLLPSPGNETLVLTVEPSEQVEGGARTVTEITIFTETGDLTSIVLLEMSDILGHWFE